MTAKKSAKKSQYCIHSFCFNKAAAFLLFFRFHRRRRGFRARQERCDEICDDFVLRFDEKRATKTIES